MDKENSKITRAERVRLHLANEIAAGKLTPGTRLDEVEQAKRFGVSRTPVREAFRELAALGLVESRPHRGVVVAAPATEPVGDLAEACGELLALCIRLGDGAAMVAPDDDQLVRGIAESCGNRVLAETAVGLWARLRPFLPDNLLTEAAKTLDGADKEEAGRQIRAALVAR